MMKLSRLPVLALVCCVCCLGLPLRAAEFFVDAERGHPDNDGSAARPWKSLQQVLDSGRVESRTWDGLPYREQHGGGGGRWQAGAVRRLSLAE